MSYERSADGTEVLAVRTVETASQTATVKAHEQFYRQTHVTVGDGQVANDGADTETVSVTVVDGLEVSRGTDPGNASVLDVSGTLTLLVDGAEVSVSVSSGTGSTDVTTTKSAGSTIDVEALAFDGEPIEPDAAAIEVTSA